MIDLFLLARAFGTVLACLCLFYVTGASVSYLCHRKKISGGWQSAYFYTLAGFFLVLSIFAIVRTKGGTIMLPVPFLVIWMITGMKGYLDPFQEQRSKISVAPFLFTIIAALAYFLFYTQGYFYNDDTVKYIGGDVAFYARVAEHINFSGKENMRAEYLFPERYSVELYHYGDIWLMALGYTLAGISPAFGAVLVAYPVLMAITCLGLASVIQYLVEDQKKNEGKYWIKYLAVCTGMIGGLSVFFPSFLFPGQVDVYNLSMANYPKVLLFSCTIPLFLYLILLKNDLYILPLGLIVGLGFINVFPAVIFVVAMWLLVRAYRRKSLGQALFVFSIVFLILGGYLYFLYGYPPGAAKSGEKGAIVVLQRDWLTWGRALRTALNIFIGGLLQLSVYLPAGLLVAILIVRNSAVKKYTQIFVFLFFLVFSGLLFWALLHPVTVESVQFFHNVFMVIGPIASLIIISLVFRYHSAISMRIVTAGILFWFLMFNFTYTFSTTKINTGEYKNVTRFVSKKNRPSFAFYLPEQDYLKSIFSSNTVVFPPCNFFIYNIPYYANYSLNVSFVRLDTTLPDYKFRRSQIDWAPMTYYIESNHLQDQPEEIIMRKFMEDYQISYLCMPVGVMLPGALSPLVYDSLSLPKEGWKFYECRY